MRKALLTIALLFSGISIFIQYKSIVFATEIVGRIREFGQVLADNDRSEEVTDFFFVQAEEIRINAQDSFIAQQISLSLLTASIVCVVVAMFLEKKPSG